MGSGFGFVLGGALKGLGAGLDDRVEQMRKTALLSLEHTNHLEEADHSFANAQSLEGSRNLNENARQQAGFEQQKTLEGIRTKAANDRQDIQDSRAGERLDIEHNYRLDEQSQQDKRTADDIIKFDTNQDGEIIGFTKGKKTFNTGIKSGSKEKDILAAAERYGTVKKSVVDPDTGERTTEETVDPARAANFLRRMGREDLAKPYEGDTGPLGSEGGADTTSPIDMPLPGQQKLPTGVTAIQAREQAKAAIAAGKSRTGVLQKLRSYGVDTSGL